MTPLTQLLLFPGFDELDVVAPLEILRSAGFELRLTTADGAPTMTGTHGLEIATGGTFDPRAGGLVLVPGGGWVAERGGVRQALAGGTIVPLIAQAAARATVGSICTGAVLLGAAGLLGGRPAATHAASVEAVAGYGAQVRRDVRVVDDGDVLTCGGVTAALDLGLHLVARYLGPGAADRAATRIEYARDPQAVAVARTG